MISHPCKHQSIKATQQYTSAKARGRAPPGGGNFSAMEPGFHELIVKLTAAHEKAVSSAEVTWTPTWSTESHELSVKRWNGSKWIDNAIPPFFFGGWWSSLDLRRQLEDCSSCSKHVEKRVRWEALDGRDCWSHSGLGWVHGLLLVCNLKIRLAFLICWSHCKAPPFSV